MKVSSVKTVAATAAATNNEQQQQNGIKKKVKYAFLIRSLLI